MAYLKKLHFGRNIRALQLAFELDKEQRYTTEQERLILSQYAGFGGLKFILNPADKKYWSKLICLILTILSNFLTLSTKTLLTKDSINNTHKVLNFGAYIVLYSAATR